MYEATSPVRMNRGLVVLIDCVDHTGQDGCSDSELDINQVHAVFQAHCAICNNQFLGHLDVLTDGLQSDSCTSAVQHDIIGAHVVQETVASSEEEVAVPAAFWRT